MDSNLRLTLYSYGSKKPKNWEEDTRGHGGEAIPCPKVPQSRAMSNIRILFQIFIIWGGRVVLYLGLGMVCA